MNSFQMPDRWSQYEADPEKYKAESDEATSRAVVEAAEKIVSRMVEEDESERAFQGSGGLLEMADNYAVQRHANGTIVSGVGERKKRIPSALSGLNMSGKPPRPGRFSMRDPKGFMMDDSGMTAEAEQDGVFDIAGTERRTASVRFEEKTDDGKRSWSSRYTMDHTLLSVSGGLPGRDVLNEMDRDSQRTHMSARNMMASSAYSLKAKVAEEKGKVFGSGFSFRQKQAYFPEANIRMVWSDVDADEAPYPPTPSVHKTWQQAMLNKQRRRRILLVGGLALIGFILVLITTVGLKEKINESGFQVSPKGLGEGVTFYVTSDVPYDSAEEDKLHKDLQNIPGDGEFIIHLGNIQNAEATLCPTTRYTDVASVLQKSPLPLIVLPGEQDWAKCPNPQVSWELWKTSFVHFEDHFPKRSFELFRQQGREENFSMVHNGVLFFGLHLINGLELNPSLQEAMLKLYFGMLHNSRDSVRAIVLFGNARPGPAQEPFFQGVSSTMKDYKLPVVYIHANVGNGKVEEYYPFEESSQMLAVQVPDGGNNPPLRVTIGFGERPFLVG
jgi:hypothetical protein